MNKNIYNKMVYYTNKQMFQHGFMFGFGYSIAVTLTISTTVLGCYVYDTVKMHMNDVKELKEKIDGKEKEMCGQTQHPENK